MKKTTGIEFMMSCKLLADESGKFFANEFRFDAESGRYIIRARINDGVNYVGMFQPDGKWYQLEINMTTHELVSCSLSPSINDESTKVDIDLDHFEANGFPDDWQEALHALSEKYLGPAVETKWDDRVIDIIKCININYGTMFIIPNSAIPADSFCINKDEKANMAKTIAELNDCEYDRSSTKLVEVWMSSVRGDWYVDNLQCHDPCIKDRDGNIYYLRFPNFLPETVLSKFKEGALEHLVFPVDVTKCTADHEPDDTYNVHHLTTIVNFKFIPAQTITRYRFCGNFEDALKKVTK